MKFIKAIWQAIKNVCRKIMKAAEYIAAGAAGAADAALNKADRKDVPGMLDSLTVNGLMAATGITAIGVFAKCSNPYVKGVGAALTCLAIVGGAIHTATKAREDRERKDIRDAKAEERKDIRDAQERKDIRDAQERKSKKRKSKKRKSKASN